MSGLEQQRHEQVLRILDRQLVIEEERPGWWNVFHRGGHRAIGPGWNTLDEVSGAAYGYTRALYDTTAWTPDGYSGCA